MQYILCILFSNYCTQILTIYAIHFIGSTIDTFNEHEEQEENDTHCRDRVSQPQFYLDPDGGVTPPSGSR